MPTNLIQDELREKLAKSFPLIHANEASITDVMQRRLEELETEGEPFGQAEVTARMLVRMLIEKGNDLADSGRLRDLRATERQHRQTGISPTHYTRFGLALVPVLCTVLGADLPPRSARAWHDVFWLIVRQMDTSRVQEFEVVAEAARLQ